MLRDPRQKRFFKAKDMSDLFQLGDQCAHAPETAQIFAGINSEIPLIEAGQATHLTTPSLLPLAEDADALPGGTAGAANAPEEGRSLPDEGKQVRLRCCRVGLAGTCVWSEDTDISSTSL